jgi:phosphoglycerate kinase
VADKLSCMPGIIAKADKVLIGGLMAFTFLAAQGVKVGKTHVEHAWLDRAKSMLETAKQKVRRLYLTLHDDQSILETSV